MKKTKPIWAENIKKRRLTLGYESALDFSEKVKISYPTYRDIENGTSEGGFEKREAIARALKWEVSDLYRDHSRPSNEAQFTEAAAFLSKYASLSPELRRIVWALVFEDPELYESHPDLKRALK